MRRFSIALALVTVALLTGAGAAGGEREPSASGLRPTRVSLPAALSIRVPAGWHVVHGWLSDVIDPAPRQLVATPRRPARFAVAAGRGVRRTCDGPTDELSFKDAGRVFQVEVYLGPGAPAAVRARVATILDSLRVGRDVR